MRHTLTPVCLELQAAIGALLLAGLIGCGQTQSDPIGQTAPNSPSGATTASSKHQTRSYDTDTHTSLQPAPPSAPERSTTQARSQTPAAPEAARPAPADTDPTAAARQQWFAEARAHSEVTVRRQALELWAEQPSQNLDPVTYALVDEDELVRTRAQELYEQQLAREATTPQPAASDPER